MDACTGQRDWNDMAKSLMQSLVFKNKLNEEVNHVKLIVDVF